LMASRTRKAKKPSSASWLAAIIESSDDAIVSKTLDGIITSWNPAAEKLFGYSADEIVGRPIATLAAPDREPEMPAILERIRRGEKVDHYETVRRRKDGCLVDISLTVSPIRDESGRIVGASKIARDIAARKQVEERQRRLTSELSHRVKNVLSVVQVLAERSASKATSVAAYLEMFRGRLQALGAAHNALIAGHWKSASLASLIQATLQPYLAERDRFHLDVQDVPLDPEVALTLAIGLHELATNASKYGALSSPNGRITLTGSIEAGDGGDELHLMWQEVGGPAVKPPTAAGFGTTMLAYSLKYQHKGRAELDWREEGLVCRIMLPFSNPANSPGSLP
jgi:PAS domain S-box-containing protein